jgi:serine/threonine-protein kinase
MPVPAPTAEFLALQRFVAGRYSLDRELGRGGMGVVFLARDVALDRPVAIKLLPATLAASTGLRERFLREARTAARLSHPHIVPIHSVESHDELAFFVMGYVDGDTLGERVRRRGPMPAHEVMRLIQEVAWALAHAHACGVVHRDVKPDNILLERGSGRAMVTDFGIAHLSHGPSTPSQGTVVGTPRYMSPEQAAGETVDARSDIYSLGITAYYALTGLHPFESGNLTDLRRRQLALPRPALRDELPRTPLALVAALERSLERDPAGRFATAEAMADAMRDARGAASAVATPVRRFVADAEAAGGEIGTAVTAGAVSLVYVLTPLASSPGLFADLITAVAYSAVGTIALGLAGARIAQVAARARLLLRGGYEHQSIRPALAIADREHLDERTASGEARRTAPWRPGVIGGVGLAATYGSLVLSNAQVQGVLLQFVGFMGTVIVPTVTLRRVWDHVRRDRPSLWGRVISGRLGRWLFGVAGAGLRDRAPAVPAAGEPTAIALGRAAGAVFDALPAADRASLADVPRLIERLEADAVALGTRRDDPRAAERLAVVVSALETLRLDLFRLQAGALTRDGLTSNIQAIRRIGEEVDARLAAETEVERLVGERETTPR